MSITAIDDTGERFGPITLNLESDETIHFNSRDLENGNVSKGLSGGVGNGEGSWRLILDSELGIIPLAYIRTSDGFVTSMHDVAPETERDSRQYRIVFFNPGSNRNQVSRLRLINPGTIPAEIEITGRDDAGNPAPGGTVRLTVPAGGARTLTAQILESGGEGITGRLGDGTGKWRLTVSSNVAIDAISLLQSPTGHLANLSFTSPEWGDTPSLPPLVLPTALPLVLPASESALTGFVRIINRSDQAGSVRITVIDDAGNWYGIGQITLNLEPNETVNINSRELERRLESSSGVTYGGTKEGNWWLEFRTTEIDISALAYIRTSDGFVTNMHDVAPSTDRIHRVRFFNPGSNRKQVSQLRLVNTSYEAARVEITGRDDAGNPAPGGAVRLTLAARESRMLTAQTLESGGEGITGRLGDGTGKWQLTVSANRDIGVMSLLQSPTGHLANLSTSPQLVDDHGDTRETATIVQLTHTTSDSYSVPVLGGTMTGILENPKDVDVFLFQIKGNHTQDDDRNLFRTDSTGDFRVIYVDGHTGRIHATSTATINTRYGQSYRASINTKLYRDNDRIGRDDDFVDMRGGVGTILEINSDYDIWYIEVSGEDAIYYRNFSSPRPTPYSYTLNFEFPIVGMMAPQPLVPPPPIEPKYGAMAMRSIHCSDEYPAEPLRYFAAEIQVDLLGRDNAHNTVRDACANELARRLSPEWDVDEYGSNPSCELARMFGHRYLHNCGALAQGFEIQLEGGAGCWQLLSGTGASENDAEADALTRCRNNGFRDCSLVRKRSGERFAQCVTPQ